MVEIIIADFLTSQLGEDVYANQLPETIDYGVYVRLLDEEFEEGKLVESIVGCFVTESDYASVKAKVDNVRKAILSMKGYQTWSSGGRARVSNLGTNAAGDEMFVVTATIYNEGD